MITQKTIDRINELARKAKSPQGLTQAERAEQDDLRKAYVASIRTNLTAQLENLYIVGTDGKTRHLPKKKAKP